MCTYTIVPGAQKETFFYTSFVGGSFFSSPYPPVVLALTVAQIHKTIKTDRLGIFHLGGGIPTVLAKFFDFNNPSACFKGGGSTCTFDSQFAWAVLVGPVGQSFYDPNVPGSVPPLLFSGFQDISSSQAATLFAIQSTLFYNFTLDTIPFPPFGNPSYFDSGYSSCVPDSITTTNFGTGYQNPACGCCKPDPNYGGCF